MSIKIAFIAPNPIQYHNPIYRAFEDSVFFDSDVLYLSKVGVKPIYNPEFQATILWPDSILSGHRSLFFRNLAKEKLSGFFSRINLGIFLYIVLSDHDVIVIHGFNTFSCWLALIAAKISRKKVVLKGEGILVPSKRTTVYQEFVERLKRYPKRVFTHLCDLVGYSCCGNLNYWKIVLSDYNKLCFLPCCVDNKAFQASFRELWPTRSARRKDMGIDGSDFVILFSARFTERKRPLDVLMALSHIDTSRIVCLFVGDGPLRKKIDDTARLLNIRVIFTGFVKQEDLVRFYSLADLFIICSSYDASPKSVNEVMNCSLPIIGTRSLGTSHDLIQHNVNGFLYDSGDTKTLAQHILKLSLNPSLARSMGSQSLKIVDKWTPTDHVDNLYASISAL